MSKMNRWEFMRCGRQPGGNKVAQLGVCRAAIASDAHGLNGGLNGGRVCWVVRGTLCGGTVQRTFAAKMSRCTSCEFYKLVKEEEGEGYLDSASLLKIIR
jgi:hypothetical protein